MRAGGADPGGMRRRSLDRAEVRTEEQGSDGGMFGLSAVWRVLFLEA